MRFFLVTTDHLDDCLLFRDDDDFRTAMNYVAVAAFLLKVSILSFILMSNHMHFVLQCTEREAWEFINKFKQLYGHHYHNKYGVRDFLRKLGVDLRELKIEDESLHRGIAYTEMNCVAAGITASPSLFPWGTGNVFFNASMPAGVRLGDLSGREQRRRLKTNVKLPQNYVIGNGGFILPRCYVQIEFIESLFRTPNRYLYFLNTSSKARKRVQQDSAPSFRDQIVKPAMNDLIYSLFRKASIDDLNQEMKGELIRQMQRRFSSDAKQLARVSGIPIAEVEDLLHGFY